MSTRFGILPLMAITVFQHGEMDTPGRLGMTFRDHGYDLDIRRLDQGAGVPSDFENVEGVIVLGGAQNTDESHPWMAAEKTFIAGAHERMLPIIGVCLGAQLVAEALGGKVAKMGQREAGLGDVDINPSAHGDTVLAGIAWKSMQFHWHEYEVTELPPGAQLLASSDACKVQAFRAGMRTYGFQYHFECDRSMIDAYVNASRGDLHSAGVTSEEFAKQCDEHYGMLARLGDRLCLNIVTYLMSPAAQTASR